MKELIEQMNDILDELKMELLGGGEVSDTVDKYKAVTENAIYEDWMNSFPPEPEEESK